MKPAVLEARTKVKHCATAVKHTGKNREKGKHINHLQNQKSPHNLTLFIWENM